MKQKKPKHVAIVMDGNGRWASQRGLARVEGHRQGVEVVRLVIAACLEHHIPILSLFTFSHENWSRPEDEVQFLMQLFLESLAAQLPELCAQGIRLNFLGKRQGLAKELLKQMEDAEEKTAHNRQLTLNIALNYTGKWDILHAAQQCISNGIKADELTEDIFSSFLSTAEQDMPDLMIRTSGEQRISNFFLWQLAYTELFFCDVFWPDFNKDIFAEALTFYASRERRFGKTSQQLKDNSPCLNND